MSRRVVILSHGDSAVPELVAALHARGVRPHALVLYAASPLREWRALPPGRRVAAFPLIPLRWARRRIRLRPRREVRGRVGRVVITGPLNGRSMEKAVRRLRPDVLLLAGCGILSPEILAIPREGTVNVHPALLPWVRGNGAVENSILLGVPLGCTTLWVDPGIDTGRVIARRLLPVAGGETLEALARFLRALWVEMAADLAAAAADGPLPAGTAQPARHPLCRAVRDPERRAAVARAVERGVPSTLFERWRPFADPRDLALPPAADALVAPSAAGAWLAEVPDEPAAPRVAGGAS
ncbi:MAG TPA: formyltransferase family protein [Longimicrobium sp.]|nr:formyltransferase family protein [Longimicrobium sp.]